MAPMDKRLHYRCPNKVHMQWNGRIQGTRRFAGGVRCNCHDGCQYGGTILQGERGLSSNIGFIILNTVPKNYSHTMCMKGFDPKWCQWVHEFVSRGSVGIRVNGDIGHYFQTKKGA
jgi:hypothetical protein